MTEVRNVNKESAEVSLAELKDILDKEILAKTSQGYTLVYKTDTEATLQKEIHKRPNLILLIFLFLFFILPGIIYLVFGGKTETKTMRIVVDKSGKVQVFGS